MSVSSGLGLGGLRPGVIPDTSSRPISPYVGQTIYQVDSKQLLVWDGNVWSDMNPVGSVQPFAGATAPTGWLLCSGQTVSRTTYSVLFSVIGTLYNTGGEAGTDFRLPDLRGRVVAGVDNMGGTDAGRLSSSNTLGTTSGSETNTHNHYQSVGYDGGSFFVKSYTSMPRSKVETLSRGSTSISAANSAGRFDSTEDEAINIMQPTMVLNYIIKA